MGSSLGSISEVVSWRAHSGSSWDNGASYGLSVKLCFASCCCLYVSGCASPFSVGLLSAFMSKLRRPFSNFLCKSKAESLSLLRSSEGRLMTSTPILSHSGPNAEPLGRSVQETVKRNVE